MEPQDVFIVISEGFVLGVFFSEEEADSVASLERSSKRSAHVDIATLR